MKKLYVLSIIACAASYASAADWKPVPGHFPMSRWASDVAPDKVLPEYPRPQMVRKDWLNLNGLWDYSVVAGDAKQPESFQGKILAPFPIEAPLSGVGKMLNAFPGRTYTNSRLWYRRTFRTPAEWKGQRTLLHFGAVDWEATVILNGKELGIHRGGYDAFSFDATDTLKKEGSNELVVAVWDPTFEGGYPRGKQIDKPAGIYYTPCTGIWQTVWLEPVPATHIESLRIVPDVDQGAVRITVTAVAGKDDGNLLATVDVYDGQTKIGSASGWASQELVVKVPDAKLWSPDSPFLYDLHATSSGQRLTQQSDAVASYFGMRKVSIGPDKDGITRILLNNKFVLHNGVLDQGFWPDGIYTAPTDAALRYDIEAIKRLGFNMSRKHVKVEPERWYYWADKLGLLIWQDMPCSGDGIHARPPAYAASTAQLQDQFGIELKAMIAGRFNHPSIVSWIVFNEGMGLQNSKGYKLDDNIRAFMRRMSEIAGEDKTRPINAESGAPGGQYQGWNPLDLGFGQIVDAHCYGTTKCIVPTKERASVIGEYGYAKFVDTIDKYMPLVKKPGVSGLVWTQITDVENERNGLLTYDRGKFTEDPEKVAAKNASHSTVENRDARWPAERAWQWYADVGPICGCNYLPRTAVNSTEMWQKETFDPKTIDEELGWAEKAGYNSVRVFLQYLVWKDDPAGMHRRINDFLGIADKHHIRAMLVPFCDCAFDGRDPYLGKQDDPLPGVHNSRWAPSPGLKRVTDRSAWPDLERYIKDLVGRFGGDKRVLIWDLYNEPGNSNLGTKSLPLVEAAFAWAREAKPCQPLTVGAWADFRGPMFVRMIELSDVVTFHGYDALAGVRAKIALCRLSRRPVLCTEWLCRGGGNTFAAILPVFAEHGVGCYHWGLVAGRTQTYMPWGSKKGDPMPAVWQHDVFDAQGKPHSAGEFEQFRKYREQFHLPENR